MRRRVILYAVGGVILAGGAWFGYQWYRRSSTPVTPMQTAEVTVGDIATSVSASGTISAPQSSTVTWQTTGNIKSIDVAVGDVVKAGDVLAVLDPNSLSAEIVESGWPRRRIQERPVASRTRRAA